MDFDTKKYINGVSGQVQLSEGSDLLDFTILLLRDGSGIVVQMGVPNTESKSIPVVIPTQQLITAAFATLDAHAREKIDEEKKKNPGVAG